MNGFDEWSAESLNAREKLLEALRNGKEAEPNPRVWQRLKNDFLREICHGKCVYCEGDYAAGSDYDGEHYRPKKAVKGTDHPGYFWLVYEWQNILLSCGKCNRPPGKGTQFPIEGDRRVVEPGSSPESWWEDLSREEPLLLHPYFDDPGEHFRIRPHGVLQGTTSRGRATISVCDLNRTALCDDREHEQVHIPDRLRRRIEEFERTDRPIAKPLFSPEDQFSFYLNALAELQLRGATT